MRDPLLWAAGASIVGHFLVVHALEQLPEREQAAPRPIMQVRIVEAPPPPPPPPPPPEPPPKEPEPIKQVHERPRAKPIVAVARDVTPRDTKAVETTATNVTDTSTTPVFGISMTSTSQGGSTTAPVGNTTRPTPAGPTGSAKPLAPPVAAFEVTRMPVPQGRCSGKYTDAARQAALEGSVVLDLIVDEQGKARDIKVVAGLGHGLTEAALAALQACRFSPGERNGSPVAVRVRGFKIRFVLQDGG